MSDRRDRTVDSTARPRPAVPDGGREDSADDGDAADSDASSAVPVAEAEPETAGESAENGTGADDGAAEGASRGRSRMRRGVDYAMLVGLGLLAFIAVIQFYLAVDATITQWVTREYRAPLRAVFNLAVLLVAAAGIYRQIDRITG